MIPMLSTLSRPTSLILGLASFLLILALSTVSALAQVGGIPAFNISESDGGSTYSLSLQILALMTALTLLPSLVLGMTSFTRIIIVLSILRQAMGTQQTPPNGRASMFSSVAEARKQQALPKDCPATAKIGQ